jgi:hypothetical protein
MHIVSGYPSSTWAPPQGWAKKSRPKAASLRRFGGKDQARRNAVLFFRRYAMKPMPTNPKIIMTQVEDSGTAPTPGPVRVKPPVLSVRVVSLTVNVRVGLTNENGPKPRADKEVSGRNSELGGDALPSPLIAFVAKICSVTPPIVSRSEPNVVLAFAKRPPTGSLPAVTTTPAALVQNTTAPCRHGDPLAVRLRVSAAVSVPENVKEVPVAVVESTVSGLVKVMSAASACCNPLRVNTDAAAAAAKITRRIIHPS